MNQVLDLKSWYLSNFKSFEESLNGESNKPVHKLRKEAIEKFSELNFPTTHDEDWKYTNIAPLLKLNFKTTDGAREIPERTIGRFLFDGMKGGRLVFVNGHYYKKFSDTGSVGVGAELNSIEDALLANSEVLNDHFGKYANYNEQIFTALSTAFTKDGAFIYIRDNAVIEDPIHILFICDAGGEEILTQPRNLIVAGKNSQAKIIEHYVTTGENTYFTNAVTEVFAGENSIIDHIKIQEESGKAFHISRMEVRQERNSSFTSHSVSTGGEISRNDIYTRFNAEGSECILNGLYLLTDRQLYDTHTMIDHAKPYCNSHEHYKGILDDKSRGVFNGKVMVRPDAQKTNAFQENNNIILSNEALVNTKPQLEIFADDVKCSHGATVGQIDRDAMFYLKSRGIGEEKSKIILLHAFASDIVKSIKVKEVKDYMEEILENRFKQD